MLFHLQGESPQISCVVSTFHMCDSPLSTFLEEGVDMCKKLLEGGAPGRAEHSIGTQKLTQIFPHEYTRQEYLCTIHIYIFTDNSTLILHEFLCATKNMRHKGYILFCCPDTVRSHAPVPQLSPGLHFYTLNLEKATLCDV